MPPWQINAIAETGLSTAHNAATGRFHCFQAAGLRPCLLCACCAPGGNRTWSFAQTERLETAVSRKVPLCASLCALVRIPSDSIGLYRTGGRKLELAETLTSDDYSQHQ